MWLAAAVVLGAPLGLVGYVARRPTTAGLLAALVVPAGAVLQPLLLGTLGWDRIVPWPSALADVVSSTVLVVGGVVGICVVAQMRLHRAHT